MATSGCENKILVKNIYEEFFRKFKCISEISEALKQLYDNFDLLPGKTSLRALHILFNKVVPDEEFDDLVIVKSCSDEQKVREIFNLFSYILDAIRRSDLQHCCRDATQVELNFYIFVFVRFSDFIKTISFWFCELLKGEIRDAALRIHEKEEELLTVIRIIQARFHAESIENFPLPAKPIWEKAYKDVRYKSIYLSRNGSTCSRLPLRGQENALLWAKLRSCRSVDDLKVENPDDSCPVCMDSSLQQDFVILDGCRHILCIYCAETLFIFKHHKQEKECPVCRAPVELWTTKRYFEYFSQLELPIILRVDPETYMLSRVPLSST